MRIAARQDIINEKQDLTKIEQFILAIERLDIAIKHLDLTLQAIKDIASESFMATAALSLAVGRAQ